MSKPNSPRKSDPVPSEGKREEEHDFNPVVDDDDQEVPGVVPPEGHDISARDDEATGIHEDRLPAYQEDIGVEYVSDTQHTDGSTHNPEQAAEQGLVYEPPHDPPVIPSDDPQGAEVAAGFAPSMEESDPDVLRLPEHVDNNDLDLEEDIAEVLRLNSETSHLDEISVSVRNRIATVTGTVPSEDDLGRAERVIREMDGVERVVSRVRVVTG